MGIFITAYKKYSFIGQIIARTDHGFVMRTKFIHIYIQSASCLNNRQFFSMGSAMFEP